MPLRLKVPSNAIITNQYDVMNRLTDQASANGYNVNYTYTLTGQRETMMDASGTTTCSYDNRDRLLKEVNWSGVPSVSLYYGYDANGNVTSIGSSTGNGVTNQYQYDALSRLTNVLANGTAAAGYGFDLAGNLQTMRYGNGVTNQYQYDTLNRLTNLTATTVSGPIASFYYQLGRTGTRTNLSESVNGTNRTNAWKYDSLYRLTNDGISGLGTNGYGYDTVGNRTNQTSTVSGIPNQSFTFNTNDWLATDQYDSNGNTTNSSGNYYQYDVMNHLTNASGTVLVTYDGDGNRASKTVSGSGTTTYYLLDDRNPSGYVQVLEEYQGTNLSRVYNYGLSLISQRNWLSGRVNYYGCDGHGSTRFLLSPTGTIGNTYTYDAYGSLIASNGTTSNNYLYCGQQYDPDLGLYYNRARYLNQNTGRFWTGDTFQGNNEDPLSLHKYLYCEGNPVNHRDLSGHDLTEMLTVVAISAVVVGEFGYTYNSVWRETAGNVGTVNVYVSPGGTANAQTVHDRIIAKAPAIEAQYRQATQLRIMNGGLPAGVSAGYDQPTHTYNVLVQYVSGGTVLGNTPSSTVNLYPDNIVADLKDHAPDTATADNFAFMTANIFSHELVHAIENRASIRSFPEHESGGLMKGFPYSFSGFSWSTGSQGMIPFSNVTEQRLETGLGERP